MTLNDLVKTCTNDKLQEVNMAWSESIKNKTRESAGFPVPNGQVIATFTDIEAMIDAGWGID